MLEEIIHSPLNPVLAFLAGLIIGHWLTVNRDKRKEYNELVAPLRKKIAAEAADPVPGRRIISRDDADAIAARLNPLNRRNFLKACKRYWEEQERQYQDDLGQPHYRFPDRVRDAIENVIRHLPYR